MVELGENMPILIGSIVVPFWDSYLEPDKVIPRRTTMEPMGIHSLLRNCFPFWSRKTQININTINFYCGSNDGIDARAKDG